MNKAQLQKTSGLAFAFGPRQLSTGAHDDDWTGVSRPRGAKWSDYGGDSIPCFEKVLRGLPRWLYAPLAS